MAIAGKKMIADGTIISSWSPTTLNMELGALLWKENPHIRIRQLWDWLCSYCYLPRLASFKVLQQAIQDALVPQKTGEKTEDTAARKVFGYAYDVINNDYIGLCLDSTAQVDMDGYLVQPDIAQKKLDEKRSASSSSGSSDSNSSGGSSSTSQEEGKGVTPIPQPKPPIQPPYTPKPRHLYVTARLDATRINQDVRRIVEEIINNLDGEKDVTMELKLELDASSKEGFDDELVKAITENCHTLKIRDFGFSE